MVDLTPTERGALVKRKHELLTSFDPKAPDAARKLAEAVDCYYKAMGEMSPREVDGLLSKALLVIDDMSKRPLFSGAPYAYGDDSEIR